MYVSHTVSNENAATTLSVNYYHIATRWLAKMQEKWSLTTHRCSFTGWGRKHAAIVVSYKGGQYLIYAWLQTNCQSEYPRWKTKYHGGSIDAHFQHGAGSAALMGFALKAATTSFLDVCRQSPFRLSRSYNKNHWRSIDDHFQDRTRSVSVLFLPRKAANTTFMNGCNQSPVRLHKMHSQRLLTLRGRSFSAYGSRRAVHCFAKTGCQYIHYGEQRPGHISITVLTRIKIVDARLTLIFWMGQGAWGYCFWLGRQPIPGLWMAATNRHLCYRICTAKNHWRSVDFHFHNAVTVWFTFLPRKAASMLVMDSTDHVTIQLPYLQD